MTDYLKRTYDLNDPDLVSVCDELPLWSAPFGMRLLDFIDLRTGLKVLDIGSGTGFPILELAQRLGKSSRIYGIDPWHKGIDRINKKIQIYGIDNVEMKCAIAEKMPFEDDFFDLIVSNNGINNVVDPRKALNECYRVASKNAQFVMTINLPETMIEFYRAYEDSLRELGKDVEIDKMKEHIAAKRMTAQQFMNLTAEAGFEITRKIEDSFSMRYIDGTAMLNSFVIRLAFIESWQAIPAPPDIEKVFIVLEDKLNQSARSSGEISLTIPYICLDCRKK